ncbi:MAG: WD40 repeat domain-containing protein [Symploca sp. SIO2E9]|nr:WD40 repeat domain-containing protein [Symploca sp. SIO2E9]
MEQWLKLLIQCAIPVFNTLVYAKTGKRLSDLPIYLDQKLKETQMVLDYLGVGSQSGLEQEQQLFPEIKVEPGEQKGNTIQEFFQNATWTIAQAGLDFHKWDFQQEKELQQQLVTYNRETLLELAAYQRETTLQLPEVHKILDHWPLRLFPSQLLTEHNHTKLLPLRIFIAPPNIQFERFGETVLGKPEIELKLSQRLREFLSQNYPLRSSIRSTEFLGGAWESKRFHSESSIKALFGMLKSEPTLILESEINDHDLTFRMAYWGLGQETYCYETILKLSYQDFIYESAKNRALKWKVTRDKLLALGKSPEEINSKGGDNAINLAILEEAEELQRAGIDLSELTFSYQVSSKDWDNLCLFLSSCHCLVAGWVSDIYHLVHQDIPPLMPGLLPELFKEVYDQNLLPAIIQTTISIYQNVLNFMLIERPYWTPELVLKLAQSLTHLPDKSWAKKQVDYSLQTWLQQRQLTQTEGMEPLQAMEPVLTKQDQEYCKTLKECLAALGDEEAVSQVQTLLNAIASLKSQGKLTNIALVHTFTGLADKVSALAISPDGQTLFSCGDDNTIKLWNLLQTEKSSCLQSTPSHILNGHSGGVLTLALSDDGQIIASSDKSKRRSYIKIWQLPTRKLLWTLSGHRKQIHALALSPDAKTLASGSHKIKLWNLQTGEPFRTLFGHKQWVYALAISSDSKTLVSGSQDMTVKIWDLRTGDLLRILNGHQDSIKAIAISPDGQTIISGSADTTIKIWDFESGKLLSTLKEHSGAVDAVAISPDNQYLISGSQDTTIKIWDLGRTEVVKTLKGHTETVSAITISSDGQTLASGSTDKTIRIWQTL